VSKAESAEVRIEYVPLSDIQKWPRNPKLHDKERIDKSIERFGFINPLVMDETSQRLVAGHGRLEALQGMKAAGKEPPKRIKVLKNGDWAVPVLKGVGFTNEQDAEAFLIADNRLVELGGWDEVGLDAMLSSMGPINLEILGFRLSADLDTALLGDDAATTKGAAAELNEAFIEGKLKMVDCPHCGGEVPV
jgi:hypothetical protein